MSVIDLQTKDLRAANSALRAGINGSVVEAVNASHLHGLAAGLKHGEIMITGDAGDYLGALNAGAVIRVRGSAGKYAGDNMTAGTLIIEGNAAYGAGQYCYGGQVFIGGSAGDFTATMNKGATILIAGDVGSECATYMLKGTVVVVGDAGENFGNYLIRGSIFIGGKWKSLGHNTRIISPDEADIAALKDLFETYGIQADPTAFRKVVAASEKPFYK
jgi:methylamine---glutamate N-methyltransferase subunit B